MKISTSLLIFGISGILILGCSKKEEKPPAPVTDIDGNTYKTVKIGTQIWMAENLKTTKLNDGSDIPLVTVSQDWKDLITSAYCWYNNDEISNSDPYGALYNCYTVTSGKLCPTGWHIPAIEEMQLLCGFLGDTLKGGGKLKESGTAHWLFPNTGATNSTGFFALPAGIRYFEGSFTAIQHFTGFWSSTEAGSDEASFLSLYYGDATVKINNTSKNQGLSIRCIKN
jgi:uncharacterized protein (TIGR02145 family)